MGDVLVTGGAGGLGRPLVERLVRSGHTVRIASRSATTAAPPGVRVYEVDVRSGTGLATAVAGADVVVHLASSPWRPKGIEVGGAGRLLAAIGPARPHLLYISIVGVDQHPFPYYRAKRAAEQVFEAGAVPFTILRATQFHSLLDQLLSLPVCALPRGATFQPIEVTEVADRMAELVGLGPSGRVDDIGGPEVLGVDALTGSYAEVRGRRPRCVTLPAAGKVLGAFAAGLQTCPDHRYGTITWRQYLEATSH